MQSWQPTILMLVASATALGQQGYREVDWPLPARTLAGTPSPWHLGEVAGVATTADGNILVLHRGAHPILEFDPDGNLVGPWGELAISEGKVTQVNPSDRAPGASGYSAVYGPAGCHACGAHSIRIDPDGNVWVVDAGGHLVTKLDSRGRVLLRLGEAGVAGTDRTHFHLPTDVGFAPNGDVYVSDGYGSARIVKFSRDGRFLLEWGRRGTGPGEFGLPHNLAVDAKGHIYVTDRDNQRIQVFDANGRYLDQWKDVGGVSSLFLTRDQMLWTGGILRNLEGDVLARLPGNPGGHSTTVRTSGEVFVAQLSGIVQRFQSTGRAGRHEP